MVVGTLRLDVLLGDVHSLKQKRSVVRPVVAELQRRYAVAAAQTGGHDLHRRVEIGVACVAPDFAHCRTVLGSCEESVAARPELHVLSARTRLLSEEDL